MIKQIKDERVYLFDDSVVHTRHVHDTLFQRASIVSETRRSILVVASGRGAQTKRAKIASIHDHFVLDLLHSGHFFAHSRNSCGSIQSVRGFGHGQLSNTKNTHARKRFLCVCVLSHVLQKSAFLQ